MLTEQNTRLAERTRIFRDLHDGEKQQAFALTMQISTALTLMETQPEAARTHLHILRRSTPGATGVNRAYSIVTSSVLSEKVLRRLSKSM